MRQGEHASTLGASVSDADQVIWFVPREVQFDTQPLSTVPNAQIERSAEAVMAFVTHRLNQSRTPTHLALMSNHRLDGLRELMIERYG